MKSGWKIEPIQVQVFNFGVRYWGVHVLSNRETNAQVNYSLVRRVNCYLIVQAVASSTISANQK